VLVLIVALVVCVLRARQGACAAWLPIVGGWHFSAALVAAAAAFTLWSSGRRGVAAAVGLGYTMDGALPALLGSIVVGLMVGIRPRSVAG
jgi:hypothetical protein